MVWYSARNMPKEAGRRFVAAAVPSHPPLKDPMNTRNLAVRLWASLGFTILATVPEAFRHPDRGFVGLHIMHRFLR